ncbi:MULTISPECIES: leucine-rich repeat domain-containing protein [Emticicia]|uniref:leucine-rich repeat domain-containing protein n=1 Tax=Emticicia TaxID=312278 RepID=UPI0007D8BBDF|nr:MULTISPECIES: leucine-rich repeat domain-containing protein [Emticicia]
MRKLFLLFIVVFNNVVAQNKKIYGSEEFDRVIMPPSVQQHEYLNLSTISLDSKQNNLMVFDLEAKKFANDFFKIGLGLGVNIAELNQSIFLPVTLFVNEKGEIDYLVYGFLNRGVIINRRMLFDSLNSTNEKYFFQIAEKFLNQTKVSKLPKQLSSKFQLSFTIQIGKDLNRKPSKTFISTISQAELCDRPDTVKTLMLNRLSLTEFPQVVFRFKNLEKLDLSNNYIVKVPKAIWSFKKLRFLSLSGNYVDYQSFKFKRNSHLKDLNLQFTGLDKIPKGLKKNKKLEILFIGNNDFITFRNKDFKHFKNLKSLNLYNVRAKALPSSIKNLVNLTELDLYHNQLQFLPKELGELKNLKTLAIAYNQLWNLPDEISSLSNLQFLYAHHNKINSLPYLPNLQLLDLGHNLFKVFPEQIYQLQDLEELDISYNAIDEIPMNLIKLDKLQKAFLRGNPFNKGSVVSEEYNKFVNILESRDVLVR